MSGSQIIAAGAALDAFSCDTQRNRLMRLEFPFQDGPQTAILLPNTLHAHEEVSRDFRFDVELLSDDECIPLKMLMGKMVAIALVRADGSLRYFNGYVSEFRFVRTDSGFAFYHMALVPWLAFARLRKDNVSFHAKSVREITEETFKQYSQADWQMCNVDNDKRLTVANQYNETDYNHLHRRWETLGLHYWYEHRLDGHTLMLSDQSMLRGPIDDSGHNHAGVIPFHPENGALEYEGVRKWTAVQRLGSGKTTLASFDYKNPVARRASAHSENAQPDVVPYEVYEDTGSDGFRTHLDGEQLAKQRMLEKDKDTQYFEAEGNDRAVQAGRTFRLGKHVSAKVRLAQYDRGRDGSEGSGEYLILSVDHDASNNYQAGKEARSHYRNRMVCVRQDVCWRPGTNFNSQPCPNPGVQTAIVVGPDGSEIYTDGFGRVRVQFHWDRLGTYNENSSPWIRVMAPAAGQQSGQIRLPRVNEEVVVVYANGNIDHPLILGSVYNGKNFPPWKLPEQSALAGLRSRELGGGVRGNHLILDDTKEKIQVQLKSDHHCSQLSLGHITRIEDTAGRKDARGEGWELRTDGHGVARAAHGMLITTEARQEARGPIKDMGETSHRLTVAGDQHQVLAKLAQQSGAQDAGDNQENVAVALQSQADSVRGSVSPAEGFPELGAPHIVVASPAGIAATTGGDIHVASDHHTGITTGKNLSLAVGKNLFASIRQTLRLFVQKAGMKLVAAGGDIDIQALSDGIKLLAKLEISQQANRITISAKEEVVINGGGSYVKFAAGSIELGTSGTFVAHAANHSVRSAKSVTVPSITPKYSSSSEYDPNDLEQHFSFQDEDGNPITWLHHRIDSSGTKLHEGALDAQGRTPAFPMDKEILGTFWMKRE